MAFSQADLSKLRDLARSLNLPFRNDQELFHHLETNDHFADHASAVLTPSKLFGKDPDPAPAPAPDPDLAEPAKILGLRPAVFGLVVVAVVVVAFMVLIVMRKKPK